MMVNLNTMILSSELLFRYQSFIENQQLVLFHELILVICITQFRICLDILGVIYLPYQSFADGTLSAFTDSAN